MKKLILTMAVAVMASAPALAQKVNTEAIKAKIEKSVEASRDAKKGTKAATWLALGKAYYEAATANTASLFPGLTYDMLVMTTGKASNADEPDTKIIGGKAYASLKYDAIEVYVDPANNTVRSWKETKPIEQDAYSKAIAAYKKAYEIDPKSLDKVGEGYKSVITALTNDGQGFYELGEYANASKYFSLAAEYSYENPQGVGENAQQLAFFSGVAAVQAEEYEHAEKVLAKLKEEGYEQNGDIYVYIATAQDKLGKKEAAKETYMAGISKYANNTTLLTQFITYAIVNGEDPSIVLPYVLTAQEADPSNISLLLAEGIVYDKMKDYDKAIVAYDKALAVDPDFFGALYNKGFAYYSKAGDYNKQIGQTDYTNKALIEELKKGFIDNMKNATVVFEKAHEVNPQDASVVELLRSSYFSLRDEGDDMKAKYEHYNALSKTM